MFDRYDTKRNKLEVFKKNEKWQNIIDEFLSVWGEYFAHKVGRRRRYLFSRPYMPPYRVSVKVAGMRIRWKKIGFIGGIFEHEIKASVNGRTVICFRRWATPPCSAWEETKVNYDRLIDIAGATRLLHKRTAYAGEMQEDNMEIFNDYLDGSPRM